MRRYRMRLRGDTHYPLYPLTICSVFTQYRLTRYWVMTCLCRQEQELRTDFEGLQADYRGKHEEEKQVARYSLAIQRCSAHGDVGGESDLGECSE